MSLATPERTAGLRARDASRRDYRAALTFDASGEAFERIVEQLGSWLREKNLDVDARESAHVADPQRHLTLIHHHTAAGRSLRLKLREDTRQGLWTTELTAYLPFQHKGRSSDGWLTLLVSNSGQRSAAVPRLATYLLDVLDVHDGAMPLLSQAQLINTGGVGELLAAVRDDQRHGLLFVAGSNGDLDLSAWADRVRFWTRDIRGIAQAVVLDPAATTEFNVRVGGSHRVQPWTIRTFLPAADTEWAPDGRRHRILGTQRLGQREDQELRRFLSAIARGHAATRPAPSVVSRVARKLERLADDLVLDAIFADPRRTVSLPPTPPAPPTAPTPAESGERPADKDQTLGLSAGTSGAAVSDPGTPSDLHSDVGRDVGPGADVDTGGDATTVVGSPSATAPVGTPTELPGESPTEPSLVDGLPTTDPGPTPASATEPGSESDGGASPHSPGEVATEDAAEVAALRAIVAQQAELLSAVAGLLEVPEVDANTLPDAVAAVAARGARAAIEAADQAASQARMEADHARMVAEVARVDRARIHEEMAARQKKIAALEDQVDFYRELFEDEEIYRVLAEDERARAEDESRWLRNQLRQHGDPETAASQVPEDSITVYPDSFEDLLARASELEAAGVVLTGDLSVTRDLDDVDGNGKLVRAAWESLLLLTDYVSARRAGVHEGSVEMYLKDTPSGYRSMSPKKHATGESGPTMAQYGHLRVHPVPADVDPSGSVCMAAHFKLGSLGMVSPRMHYHDDYARTGSIFVGYIGPHLRTVNTN